MGYLELSDGTVSRQIPVPGLGADVRLEVDGDVISVAAPCAVDVRECPDAGTAESGGQLDGHSSGERDGDSSSQRGGTSDRGDRATRVILGLRPTE